MLVQMILLGVSSLIASGVLFRHRTVLTYLAAAGILWEAQWLFLTLLARTWLQSVSPELVYLLGVVIILLGWLVPHFARRASRGLRFAPSIGSWDWRSEVAIAVVLLLVLGAARMIFSYNSFNETSSFVTHGFFNGDTATLMAITQRAFSTGGLVNDNPFAGNGSLEYPSLLHSGLATLLRSSFGGQGWWEWLPLMTYFQIFLTVPMFFLVWEAVLPEKRGVWPVVISAAVILFVLMLSWESYVYPQGHFFLVGMFLMMGALLTRSAGKTIRESWPELGVAVLIGAVLLFSNAVTGTAAVLLKIVFDGLQGMRRGISMGERVGWGIGVTFWIVMFFLFTPGNGSLALVPHFAYTAAGELGRLGPVIMLLAIGMFWQFERKLFLSLTTVALLGLAFVTFVFSSRGIVVENSSRFMYHGLLLAFPLLYMPLVRSYYWFRREFLLSSRTFQEKVLGWGMVVVLLGIFLLPAGASVASTHDNLMFKDEHQISGNLREAASWILHTTDSEAIFLANPETPFWIPVLSGRAMLRSDFWLSPDDVDLANVKAAFKGNMAAQEAVTGKADYLAIISTEAEFWKLGRKPVFKNSEVAIYELR